MRFRKTGSKKSKPHTGLIYHDLSIQSIFKYFQIALNCGALQLHFFDLFHERCGALVAEAILAAESHFGHLWAIPNEG